MRNKSINLYEKIARKAFELEFEQVKARILLASGIRIV
jgi:hypothetical protein